jgi:hypothetical protein
MTRRRIDVRDRLVEAFTDPAPKTVRQRMEPPRPTAAPPRAGQFDHLPPADRAVAEALSRNDTAAVAALAPRARAAHRRGRHKIARPKITAHHLAGWR